MIPFKAIIFRQPNKRSTDDDARGTLKDNLPSGRVAVTNMRMIFICLNETGENFIKKCKKTKKIDCDHYAVDASFTHSSIFFPINLASVIHIRFKMAVRTKTICSCSCRLSTRYPPCLISHVLHVLHALDMCSRLRSRRKSGSGQYPHRARCVVRDVPYVYEAFASAVFASLKPGKIWTKTQRTQKKKI